MSSVMGSFCLITSPLTRLIPFRIDETYQLLASGFFSPVSRCKMRTAFKHWRVELKDRRLDKKAIYLPRSVCDMGTGLMLSLLQKSKYDDSCTE